MDSKQRFMLLNRLLEILDPIWKKPEGGSEGIDVEIFFYSMPPYK